jgi:muramoyltetrapeptide carboxypeptidase LdcA involved in peptidoglycan recycling
MDFVKLPKLKTGDTVGIVSPSFAAPAAFPHVYKYGLKRLQEIFDLKYADYPTTAKLGASGTERAADLIAVFEDKNIKAVIASIGGDDQVTYIKNLPKEPFSKNPKPFFGYSDNTHFCNFLWHLGIPSYYGGALFIQFAMNKRMDELTVEFLKHALFDEGEFLLKVSDRFSQKSLDWKDENNLDIEREYQDTIGWQWEVGEIKDEVRGVLWGGCLESIDELLRHGIQIPTLEQFENVILFTETSEEMPDAEYVRRVYRALGERGILEKVRGILVGRPKAWEFDKPLSKEESLKFKNDQKEVILKTVRNYNQNIPIIFEMDFGHTDPQICLPYGGLCRIDAINKNIWATF